MLTHGHGHVASSHIGEMWDIDTYHVFGPDGRWLAAVPLPDGMGRIFEVGENYVLASWQDEDDVQYVRMHTIDKGGQ